MPDRDIRECDVCSAPQIAANHWFVLVKTANKLAIMPADSPAGMGSKKPRFYACGQQCMNKAVEFWVKNEAFKGEPADAR